MDHACRTLSTASDALTRVKKQVQEVKHVMIDNIERVIQRGEVSVGFSVANQTNGDTERKKRMSGQS